MGLDGCTKYLPGLIKPLNNYISESLKNRKLMNISGKEQTGVDFAHTQYKDTNGNKNTNIKGDSHRFQCGKQDHWEAACPDLKSEPCEQLHANVGI